MSKRTNARSNKDMEVSVNTLTGIWRFLLHNQGVRIVHTNNDFKVADLGTFAIGYFLRSAEEANRYATMVFGVPGGEAGPCSMVHFTLFISIIAAIEAGANNA